MKYIFVMILSFWAFDSYGQRHSYEEFTKIIKGLEDKKILSQKGYDYVRASIDRHLDIPNHLFLEGIEESYIFVLLANAFEHSQKLRSTVFPQTKKGKKTLKGIELVYMPTANKKIKQTLQREVEDMTPTIDTTLQNEKVYIHQDPDWGWEWQEDYIDSNRSCFGKTVRETLSDLMEMDLVAKDTYSIALNLIKINIIKNEVELCRFLGYTKYLEELNEITTFLDIPEIKNMLDHDKFVGDLMPYIRGNKSFYYVLSMCKNTYIFSANYTQYVGNEQAQILQDFKNKITIFNLAEPNVMLKDSIDTHTKVSISLGGKHYSRVFKVSKADEMSKYFCEVINQFLAEKQDERRLYFIYRPLKEDSHRDLEIRKTELFCLALLDKKQYAVWKEVLQIEPTY